MCLSNGFGRALNTKRYICTTYDSVCDAKQVLEKYFMFYNQNRSHTALDDKTPNKFYFDNLAAMQKAE